MGWWKWNRLQSFWEQNELNWSYMGFQEKRHSQISSGTNDVQQSHLNIQSQWTSSTQFSWNPLIKMFHQRTAIPQMAWRCRCRQYHPYYVPLGVLLWLLWRKNSAFAPYLTPLSPDPCPECSFLFFLRNFIFPSAPCPDAMATWKWVDSSPSRQQSQHCY